jgi:hypothetical protein
VSFVAAGGVNQQTAADFIVDSWASSRRLAVERQHETKASRDGEDP